VSSDDVYGYVRKWSRRLGCVFLTLDLFPCISFYSSVATSQPGASTEAWDKETEYIVYAPAGKLGIVLDNPDDKGPVVYIIKETSPLMDKIEVGDRLVAVDEVDVRAMSPTKVSKLISKRSANPMRKFTLLRHKKPPKEEENSGEAQQNPDPPREEEKNSDEVEESKEDPEDLEDPQGQEDPQDLEDPQDPPTPLLEESKEQQQPPGVSPKKS